EAQALARLDHPNIVTVYDVGTEGENMFVAMELIDGSTLDGWLSAAPRTWRTIRDVFLAAGRGLAAAHAAGIVHRDFKPRNVIVGRDGRVRVADFGLARPMGTVTAINVSEAKVGVTVPNSEATAADSSGIRAGTPAYMAPEQ